MLSKDAIYIHYGSSRFDIEKFEEVQNCDVLSKPVNGGLWASPEGAEDGWQKINAIRPQDRFSFKFQLISSAKVLMLDNKDIIDKLPQISSKSDFYPVTLDFEKLSTEYDVIYYKYNREMDEILPSWDCDCILVMNPNVIQEIK